MGRQIFPICYFAPVHWYAAWLTAGNPVIEIHAWYKKQQLCSRAWIDHPGGPIALSIPVERRSSKAPISEKGLSFQENWQRSHFRSISNAYRNSPFFAFYEDELAGLYAQRPASLMDWLLRCHEWIVRQLGQSQATSLSQEYLHAEPELDTDLRERFPAGCCELPLGCAVPPYEQMFQQHRPGLSVLDMMMMKGPEAVILLKQAGREGFSMY